MSKTEMRRKLKINEQKTTPPVGIYIYSNESFSAFGEWIRIVIYMLFNISFVAILKELKKMDKTN